MRPLGTGTAVCLCPAVQDVQEGVRTYLSDSNVDLVIVRENTEDLYAGVEFQAGESEYVPRLISYINEAIATGKKIGTGATTTGVSVKPISVEGTRKISRPTAILRLCI